jgi:hypothetical protein
VEQVIQVLMVPRSAARPKGPLGIQGEIFQQHRALLPHVGNCIGTVAFHISKGWGACPENGMNTMLGKIIIGLTAVAAVMVIPTMSASAQQTPAQQKKVTVNIPKQVCEIVTVGTQNWGQQTVQVCGPPGGPRGQATAMSPKLKYRQAKPQ